MPSTQNHVLGSGRLLFARFDPDTLINTSGYRYLGNSPDFAISAASTTLDHVDTDNGLRVVDDSVQLTLTRSGSFTLDDISMDNLAIFLSGTKSIVAQSSVSAPTGTQSINGVAEGGVYQIGETPSNPSGVRSIVTLLVKNDAGSPVTYVLNTDYTVDLETGLLTLVSIADGGAIIGGTNLRLTYGLTAVSRERLQTAALGSVTGKLRFISKNARGAQRDFFLPYVQLTPNGDTALKGETWQLLPFNMQILKLNSTTESIYADGRPYVPA